MITPWRIPQVALVGACAGACAALADVASTVLWLSPGPDRVRLVAVFTALGLAFGAAIGLVAALFDRALSRWIHASVVRHAALVTLPLAAVAHGLFQGGRMRRLPIQWALQPGVAVLLVVLCALALTRLRAFATSLPDRTTRMRHFVAAVAVVAGGVLHAADHRVLPRLYEQLHMGLGVMTALAYALALVALVPSRWRRHPWSTWVSTVALVLSLIAGVGAWRALHVWPNVRAELFGAHAPFVRHGALAVVGLFEGHRRAQTDSLALRRARIAREQRSRSTLQQGAREALSFQGAHVLLITVDAMRADRLGRRVAGRSITPTLDALTTRAVVFTNAYAQAPHSSYSLTSLHTGEYLHETLPLGQRQPLTTLADLMRSTGRTTVALYTRGVFFTESERLTSYRDADFGFARATHVDRDADAQAAATIAELDEIARHGEPPSLVWTHFFDAHAPYQGRGATALAQYDHAVSRVDAAIGRILEHARQSLAREVIVAITADHGEEFNEHGGVYHGSALYEEQVRVPLVIAAPGVTAARVDVPVELIDVAPTLAGLAGVQRAPTMRGRDLRPWMLTPPTPLDDVAPVFSAVNTRKMVRHGVWKLIADLTYGVDELYDLSSDAAERRNLAGSQPERRAALHAELSAWLESLTDRGSVRGAIARGRVGDRSAIEGLNTLAHDIHAPATERVEAIELLAGFADSGLRASLRPLLDDRTDAVRDAAAIALGRAGDTDAAPRLYDLVMGDPAPLRRRAAFALGALGDPAALDGLIEALWSRDESESVEAARALGALGDARALEPLLTVFPDDHLRYRVVLALGQIGGPRVFETLCVTALHDPADDARANAIAALGALGDRRAVPVIVSTIQYARAERYAAEALGALGVVGTAVDGFDARNPEVTPETFDTCGPHEDTLGWRYLGARSCVSKTSGGRVEVPFVSRRSGLHLVVIRARRDDGPPVRVPLRINGRVVSSLVLTTRWDEWRLPLTFTAGDVLLSFELPTGVDAPRMSLDHVLSLPARR